MNLPMARKGQWRTPTKDSAAVKTLRKALIILDEISDSNQPMTIAEVATKVGVTRPTAHRLVQTLIRGGYLSQHPRDGKITPGYSILQLAGRLLDANRLRVESLPHLESLARSCGERTNLGILHNSRLLYLAGIEKPNLPTIYTRFGKTIPAYCSSLGKAILANLSEEDLKEYLAATKLSPFTKSTITDKTAFLRELIEIRRQSYAVDNEEHTPGVFCISSAILLGGEPIGAIGVTARSLETLMPHLHAIKHTAEVITHVLSRGK